MLAVSPIVLVFGRLCSGKGTYSEQYTYVGYTHITTSDVVTEISGKTSRSELTKTGDLDTVIASTLIDKIKRTNVGVVVDGIRQSTIVEAILAEFGDKVRMIWLDVPDDIRRVRFDYRAASKDDKSFDECEASDSALGLDQLEEQFKSQCEVINNC